MDHRQELLAFLEDLLADLKQKKAGLRKTDLIEEVIGILSATEDEELIRQQLLRLDEMVKQLEPEETKAAHQENCDELLTLIQGAHKESLMMERRFQGDGELIFQEVERSLRELEQVSASYQDLINTERLSRRIGMIEERYIRAIRSRQEQLAKDVTEEYGHAVGKVQNMILYSNDDKQKMSQKELYERYGSSYDTFEHDVQAETKENLTGDAFRMLANSIGQKVQGVLKNKTCLVAIILILTAAGWAGGIGGMFYQVNQAVEQSVSDPEVIRSSVEKLGVTGDLIQFAAGEDTLEEMDRKFGDSASKAVYALLKYLLKAAGIVVVCFYVILIPVLVRFRKRACIKNLEKIVPREIEHFFQKGTLKERLKEAAHHTVLQIEERYAKEYRDLYDRILKNTSTENDPDDRDRALAARWRQMKRTYITDMEER